jgi:protein tyrosine phosphatase
LKKRIGRILFQFIIMTRRIVDGVELVIPPPLPMKFADIDSIIKKGIEHVPHIQSQFKVITLFSEQLNYASLLVPSEPHTLKDRWRNIRSSIKHQVSLQPIEGQEDSTYFNGSKIQPSLDGSYSYVATQAPTLVSIPDFWRAIYETNSRLIIMLTKHIENDIEKAITYWPSPGEIIEIPSPTKLLYVCLLPNTKDIHYPEGSLIERSFLLWCGKEARIITHLQYQGWPDNGVPEVSMVDYIAFLSRYRYHRKDLSRETPIFVHCSAGVGRTGTFIAIDSLLDYYVFHQHQEHNRLQAYCSDSEERYYLLLTYLLNVEFDLPRLVMDMRMCRIYMVQNIEQYQFIYRCLHYCLTHGLLDCLLLPWEHVIVDDNPHE